jgi:hypothetical protein
MGLNTWSPLSPQWTRLLALPLSTNSIELCETLVTVGCLDMTAESGNDTISNRKVDLEFAVIV